MFYGFLHVVKGDFFSVHYPFASSFTIVPIGFSVHNPEEVTFCGNVETPQWEFCFSRHIAIAVCIHDCKDRVLSTSVKRIESNFFKSRIQNRVTLIHTVDLGTFENNIRLDLYCPESSCCIGRKIGISRFPPAKNDDPSFFKVTNCAAADETVSAIWTVVIADISRVILFFFSSISWRARPLIIVASIPILSAFTRSMPFAEAFKPRKNISAADYNPDLYTQIMNFFDPGAD